MEGGQGPEQRARAEGHVVRASIMHGVSSMSEAKAKGRRRQLFPGPARILSPETLIQILQVQYLEAGHLDRGLHSLLQWPAALTPVLELPLATCKPASAVHLQRQVHCRSLAGTPCAAWKRVLGGFPPLSCILSSARYSCTLCSPITFSSGITLCPSGLQLSAKTQSRPCPAPWPDAGAA